MTERNICVEAKCKAACCRNIILNGLTEEELNLSFPNAIESDPQDFGVNNLKKGRGVYFANTSYLPDRPYQLQIVGSCPNLTNDYYCGFGSKRPEPCRNFQVGSYECTYKRAEISLPSVDINLVREARKLERERDEKYFL